MRWSYIVLALLASCYLVASEEPTLLITTIGHSGQLNSLLTLARELSERNVSFYFATSLDRKHVVDKIKGATFVSIGENTQFSRETAEYLTQNSTIRTVNGFFTSMRILTTDAMYKDVFRNLEEFVTQHRPTMMVLDAATFAAIDVAKKHRIPYIANVPFGASGDMGTGDLLSALPAFGTGFPLEPSLGQWIENFFYKVNIMKLYITNSYVQQWIKLKEGLGVSDPYDLTARNSPYMIAYMINSILGLDYAGNLVTNDLKFAGVMIRDKDESPIVGDLLKWLDEAPNVIYVSLGTIARLNATQLQELVDGLDSPSLSNIRVLWKAPVDTLNLIPKQIETSKFRFEQWVPSQVSVLNHPSVKLFISHGGGNGYHEGIYAGKPQLVLPMWIDCFDYAERIESLHIGRALFHAPRFTAKEITENVNGILSNDSYTTEARYWSMRLRNYGGPSFYADFVLSCLPRPLSCRVDYIDPMKNYIVVLKFVAPIFAWVFCTKLIGFIISCCSPKLRGTKPKIKSS